MYSLIETAKIYGLNPRDYLSYLFMKGAVSASWELGREILEPLMPWNVTKQALLLVNISRYLVCIIAYFTLITTI